MDPLEQFYNESLENIRTQAADSQLKYLSSEWNNRSASYKYTYNFGWLGRPIIQYPQDMIAMQELIWQIKPDLIVETGIAHGGSLIFSASMLALLDLCEAAENGTSLNPNDSKRKVIGIDIDIREHNLSKINAHPLRSRIELIQGSSTSKEVLERTYAIAEPFSTVLVCLDSNHTHEHVLAELEAYAPLVSKGSYCVVFDTIIEDMPAGSFPDRPWDIGNNPKTAVHEFLRSHPEFEIDGHIPDKLLITVAPDGYLKRTF